MSTNNNANSGNTIMLPGGWFTIGVGGGGGGGFSSGDLTGEFSKPKAKKSDKDGCDCKKCKVFYQYSEPNKDDGTLVCWACRNGY